MLKPTYTTFPQRIWKIVPDLNLNRFSIESRDSSTKKTYGWSTVLDQSSIVPIDIEGNWWCSLITVHEGFSVWQGLEEEGLPIPKGIYVFDQLSGRLAWENPELAFLHCGPETIIATTPQDPNRVYFLDIGSGKVRDEILREDLPLDFLEEYEQRRFDGLLYPEHLSPGADKYVEVKHNTPPMADQTGPMNYLVMGEYQLLHRYHLNPETQEIDGFISILKDGEPFILDIPTGQYPNGFALDSFFVMNNWVVWVEFPDKLGRMKLE